MINEVKHSDKSGVTTHFEIKRSDLPLHCPRNGEDLWCSHPRVFLDVEKTGQAQCPYCGADYTLVD